MTVTRRLTVAEKIALQRALADRGLYPGEIDGIYGPKTREAVRMVQEDLGGYEPNGLPSYELMLELGVITPPAPKAKPFPVPDFLLKAGLKLLLNKLFPGKDIPMDNILVAVKSAWASKLNWTMAAGVVFNLLMLFGLQVPEDVQAQVYTAGNSVIFIVGWIIRTWFTQHVTTASAKKAAL